MSGDTPTAPPPQLRLFSAGIRFVAPTDSFLVNIFPLMVQAANEQDAMGEAWGIFRSHTYNKEKDLYLLMGYIIFPFHVGVVDCTDFLNSLAEAAKEHKPKQKPRQRKTQGNVVELFPGATSPAAPIKKDKGPPRKTPPKKPPRTPTKK